MKALAKQASWKIFHDAYFGPDTSWVESLVWDAYTEVANMELIPNIQHLLETEWLDEALFAEPISFFTFGHEMHYWGIQTKEELERWLEGREMYGELIFCDLVMLLHRQKIAYENFAEGLLHTPLVRVW